MELLKEQYADEGMVVDHVGKNEIDVGNYLLEEGGRSDLKQQL